MNAIDDYKKVTEKIIAYSLEKKDTASLAKAYSYLGDYYGNKFVSESAYLNYYMAEKLYKKLNDKTNTAKTLLNKAVIQSNESDFVGSEKSALDALKYLRTVNNDEISYEANNILGVIYSDLSEFEKSVEYNKNALAIASRNNISSTYQAKATSLNNLGYVYTKMNKYPEAIICYRNALEEENLFYDKIPVYAMLIDNLAQAKFKTKDLNNLPKLYYDALKIRDSLNITLGIITSKLNLSEYYHFKHDSLKSKKFAYEANSLAKKNKMPKEILLSLKQMSIVDAAKKGIYSEEYIKINDSLQLAERQVRNKLARIEYETEELTIEKGQLIERQKTMIYIGLGIFLIGIFIYVIRFQAAKNRELRLVQEQQQANEEIYQLMINQQNKIEEVRQLEKKRIAQELHDGVLGKLFGTRMHLGMLNEREDKNANTERVVFIEELQTLEQEIREISHDLNSEKTAVFNNFVVMVTNFIETQKNICKAAIAFSIDPNIEWNKVDNIAKINFYRILQEAFQNINKYANAQNVTVAFEKTGETLVLTIEDDGVGFVNSRKKKGIGLQNMESRMQSSGGTLQIESQPQKGTSLRFELPLEANA